VHYNEIIQKPFIDAGFDVVYQPSCLQRPYTGKSWTIQYPEVNWTDNTIVLMHCQDFVNVDNGMSIDLLNIEHHFGERSNQVVVIVWNLNIPYEGPLNIIYFPTHSYEFLTELQKTQHIWGPKLLCDRDLSWQCLNGTIKPHRVNVAHYLQDNFANGILSLHDEIPLMGSEYSKNYSWDNVKNWELLQPVYSRCRTNIVTETMYSSQTNIVTEKTLMALLALQVPVVIGHKGVVAECQILGFDMFDDIVDIDYDYYPAETRWHQAIELNKSIINGSYCYDSLQSRLIANQEYVLHTWPSKLVEQFNNNAQDIALHLRQLA
jgi:hypothetical protein